MTRPARWSWCSTVVDRDPRARFDIVGGARGQLMVFALLSVVVLASLSGCVVSATPTPRTTPRPTPALSQWPPFPVASEPPPGLAISLDGRTVTISNDSGGSLWMSPPVIELWEGGNPWVESEVPSGSRELSDRSSLSLDVPVRQDAVRVGARLWARPTPGAWEVPVFLWIEVPPSAR